MTIKYSEKNPKYPFFSLPPPSECRSQNKQHHLYRLLKTIWIVKNQAETTLHEPSRASRVSTVTNNHTGFSCAVTRSSMCVPTWGQCSNILLGREALTSTVYLINCVPSAVLDFQTPFDVFHKAVLAFTVPNLPPCVFQCVAFVHLPKEQQNKLESRALKCVFVGYSSSQKMVYVLSFSHSKNLCNHGCCFSWRRYILASEWT